MGDKILELVEKDVMRETVKDFDLLYSWLGKKHSEILKEFRETVLSVNYHGIIFVQKFPTYEWGK